MKMYAFHCGGEKTLRSVFDPFDPDCGATIHPPYFFYLIRHPEGDVLFDNGAHPGLISDPRGRLGAAADLYDIVMAPVTMSSAGWTPSGSPPGISGMWCSHTCTMTI